MSKSVIEREKSQVGRLYSIFIFSGIMLYMANKRTLTNFDNSVLLISGVLVATSVGQAYFINKKRLDDVR
jgi:hypothetical protein